MPRRAQPPARWVARRTSEFWYEEEDEYDAVTDAVQPKVLVLVTPPHPEQLLALREWLEAVPFVGGFTGEAESGFAQLLWAGRDKAPLFLKMRNRAALGGGADVQAVLLELLQQNWRMELDAGLGRPEPEVEWLLLVCSCAAAGSVLAACGAAPAGGVAPGWAAVVSVGGTAAGEAADWGPRPKRVLLSREAPQQPGGPRLEPAKLLRAGRGDALADLA